MQNNKNTLGSLVKSARKNKDLTREQLAEMVHISVRYLTAIENQDKKPSFIILYRLVRVLGIPADSLFYPETQVDISSKEQLVRMINQCDEQDIKVLFATAEALLKQKVLQGV